MDYGKVFKNLREERGMSRAELSSLLGVTKSALWKIENGQSVPKQSTIVALSGIALSPVARIVIEALEPSDYEVKKK